MDSFSRYWPLWGESTRHRWIPLTKVSDGEFDVLFDLRLNKRLCKQSRRRWFETPSRSLWRHCNDNRWQQINDNPGHQFSNSQVPTSFKQSWRLLSQYWNDRVVILTQHWSLSTPKLVNSISLQWRHDELDEVSNHQPRHCILNRLSTHWGRDKMAAIFQTTFSNGFSWMKMYEFLLTFHWSLFIGV